MFAIRYIVKNKLFAIVERNIDAFETCFNQWQDVSFLFRFFTNNPDALTFYGLSKREAIDLILKEQKTFFLSILKCAKENKLDKIIFKPLHKGDDFDIPMLETKAYGKSHGKSLLRLYAIRIQDGSYIITGGLIKTTRSLQESEEGKKMIKQIQRVFKFLQKKGIVDIFELETLLIEN